MSSKFLAVLIAGACLLMSIPASASPAKALAPQTAARTTNQPPLPPGGAVDIREAQGIGRGVVILGWVAGTGALVAVFLSIDKDDESSSPTTGTH